MSISKLPTPDEAVERFGGKKIVIVTLVDDQFTVSAEKDGATISLPDKYTTEDEAREGMLSWMWGNLRTDPPIQAKWPGK